MDKYYLSGKAPEAALAESLRMKADTIVMRKSVSYLASIGSDWRIRKRIRFPGSVGILRLKLRLRTSRLPLTRLFRPDRE